MADAAEDLSGNDDSGSQAPEVAEWASGIEDEDLRGTVGKFESQEAALTAIGYKAPEPTDWREDLPEDLRKTADRFTSKEDAVRSIENFRKRENQIRVPGKDASEDDVKAFHKAMGVPETPDAYDWPKLENEGEEEVASREEWGKRLHSLNIPGEAANALSKFLKEDLEKAQEEQVTADKAFADKQEDDLKSEWKGEAFEQNKTLANRAFTELATRAGLNVEDLNRIETKDGRFLMDRAEMSRIFAVIGKEMSEGTLGSTVTTGERETMQEQLTDIRGKIAEAQAAGNSKQANSLYQKEQNLIAKLSGSAPVVGSHGRSA